MFALFVTSALALAEPQGRYAGSTRVTFKKISVEMATVSSSGPGAGTFSLKVTGIPGGHVDCPTEEYHIEGTDLQMPNMETEGDCAHDQFKSSSLTLISATYDPAGDAITMKAKWKAISVTIVAKKVADDMDFDAFVAMTEFLEEEVSAPALAEPKGHYEGSTRVALKKIRVIMETVSSSGPGKGTFSLQVKGIPGGHVDCPTEEYLVVDNDLQMPNMETEGDCAHDDFKSSSLTLTSATYDPDSDAITMKAKWKKINVTIVAKKTAAFDFEESTGSLERLQRLQLAN